MAIENITEIIKYKYMRIIKMKKYTDYSIALTA